MVDLRRIGVTERAPGSGPEWTLTAGGDFCIIDRLRNTEGPEDGVRQAITEELHELVAGADVAIANMEGPIRTCSAPISKSGPAIQMDTAAPFVLKRMGFDVVSLANNHIMDYGVQGLVSTIEACRREGLLISGAGNDEHEAMKPAEVVIAGRIRVSILAFCEREFGVAEGSQPGSAWISHPRAFERVAKAAETADVVVVLAHGGVEDVPFSPVQRRAQLRQFIDAGATLVIGHHPHVPQGWERYQKGMIFYSLGDFLFDYPGGACYPKTGWGLVIQAHFCGAVLSEIELVPVGTLADRRVGRLRENRNSEQHLRYLHRLSALLAEADAVIPYWQETAVRLWATRYQPWLLHACGAEASVSADSVRFHLSGLYRGVRRRIGWWYQRNQFAQVPEIKDGLLLLNMTRNESHHWTIETALGVLHGDVLDRRTPEIRSEVSELLTWTQG
jgi:poly-gamma-glutamate synthesis protein (capsule biosynthesis protein)